jgi:TnpA family transposase
LNEPIGLKRKPQQVPAFENQRYRASVLNLVVAAIILWNTVYLDRAIQSLRTTGQDIDEKLLPH